jgi:hypothetical protein
VTAITLVIGLLLRLGHHVAQANPDIFEFLP